MRRIMYGDPTDPEAPVSSRSSTQTRSPYSGHGAVQPAEHDLHDRPLTASPGPRRSVVREHRLCLRYPRARSVRCRLGPACTRTSAHLVDDVLGINLGVMGLGVSSRSRPDRLTRRLGQGCGKTHAAGVEGLHAVQGVRERWRTELRPNFSRMPYLPEVRQSPRRTTSRSSTPTLRSSGALG